MLPRNLGFPCVLWLDECDIRDFLVRKHHCVVNQSGCGSPSTENFGPKEPFFLTQYNNSSESGLFICLCSQLLHGYENHLQRLFSKINFIVSKDILYVCLKSCCSITRLTSLSVRFPGNQLPCANKSFKFLILVIKNMIFYLSVAILTA